MTIKEFHNKETGMSSKVEQLPNGKFKVSLIDDDAGKAVPWATITYSAEMKDVAITKAKEVLG